ncbi:MAG: 2-oxo acid dehydrogenase subunit E2, partial [Propionibacteriaceae bacterium]|nr:2-oxo acid dehydrogenase subunit E2 [Propionibacteriaceae bacterium]
QQLDQDTHTQQTHTQVADTFTTSAPVSFRSDERKPLSPREASPVGAPLPGPGAAPAAPVPSRGAILAKPPVRKLAKDLAVNLDSIAGTGAGGVITRGDVEAAAAAPPVEAVPAREDVPVTAAAANPVVGEDTRIAVKGVRKLTAEAMVASAFTAPHVTEWLTCDVSAAMELLERLKARREFVGVRISPLLLVAKAVCLALGRTPGINAFWDADSAEIVIKGNVNLGIAAATPRGLLVPNIKNAARLSLLDLAVAINDLVGVAKEGRTQPSDTAHGTFTITNVGVFGVDAGTPILNPGEAGILCLGAIARRPWVVGVGDEERIEPRWVTTLAVSFDHRVVDGEQGSTFLSDVAGILSDPGISLLF